MAESKKFNLKNELLEADERIDDMTEILGKSMLTFPQYNNAMRTVMMSSHMNQFTNMENPDFPRVFTNFENIVGKNSDGYLSASHNYEVYAKVTKFEDIVDHPTIFKLFVYCPETDTYDVITRKPIENLTEVFGYKYNNDAIDQIEPGDKIKKGDILYKSKSYDEYMNYRYGKNIRVMFSLDPDTSEDAAVCSRSLSKMMATTQCETVSIPINPNDYPLNIYGDDEEFKSFPEIGEMTNGVLMTTRRQYNDQLLFDFRSDTLKETVDGDTSYYINGMVEDIEIYCNNDELEDNTFNHQIIKYLDSQNKFYEEIKQVCEEIIATGSNISSELDYLYKRTLEMLSTTKKWKLDDNVFSNILMNVTVSRSNYLAKGSKLTGRFGNKSVIAKIREDEEMPFTENGERIDLILNLLAFINRTIAAPLFEVSTNFIIDKAIARMRSFETYKEREDLLFDVVGMFNPKQEKKMKSTYKKLTKREQKDYIDCAMDGFFFIHQPPLGEDKPWFYRLIDIYKKYDWLEPDDIYINKFGRTIKCLQKQYIGRMYVIPLKQTSRKGFSARGMGAVNAKGLPERSYKSKAHTELYSTSNIRFGEFESLNFLIGMEPEELALIHAYYRTSEEARKDIAKNVLKPDGVFKIDKIYVSRVAEIFSVLLKSLGEEIDIIDDKNEIKEVNDSVLEEYPIGDVTYLCTEYQKFIMDKIKFLSTEILKEKPETTTEEVADQVNDQLLHSGYVLDMKNYAEKVRIFRDDNKVVDAILTKVDAEE